MAYRNGADDFGLTIYGVDADVDRWAVFAGECFAAYFYTSFMTRAIESSVFYSLERRRGLISSFHFLEDDSYYDVIISLIVSVAAIVSAIIAAVISAAVIRIVL